MVYYTNEKVNKHFIKIVKNYKGGKMSRSIQLDSDGNDITCMKEFDALKYPCRECNKENCDEREEYKETESRK